MTNDTEFDHLNDRELVNLAHELEGQRDALLARLARIETEIEIRSRY